MRGTMILALGTALFAAAAVAAPKPEASKPAAPADPTLETPGWKAPRNAAGQPDLSGFWSSATMTPTTRNLQIGKEASLPAEKVKVMEARFAAALAQRDETKDPNHLPGSAEDKAKDKKLFEVRPDFEFAGGDVGGYNIFWLDPGNHILEVNGQFRTSIVTTPDGQIPPRKDGKSAARFNYNLDEGATSYLGSFDSYEMRPEGERCITFARNAPPPMLPNGYYNNNYQILQTRDAAVIVAEGIHDARIVRLNAAHRTDGLRPRMGDSIGHYEGNSLVVETTNLPQPDNFYGAWKNLKVTEWFTRVSPSRVKYRFQIEDADTWEKPWGGEYEFFPLHGVVYEYACHEGNYALPAILAGARRQEKEAAQAGKAKTGED